MNKIEKYNFPENELFKNQAISSISLAEDITKKVNEVIDMINELNDLRDNKYQEQDGKIQEAILYLKNNIQNTTYDIIQTMKSNGELDTVINTAFTRLNDALASLYNNRIKEVDDFIPDNPFTLDDSEIIQKAIAEGGDNPSVVRFSKKEYTAKGTINLYSNTEIDLNGATIKCVETNYNDTTRDSGGLRFINSNNNMETGIENVVIKNGIFKGDETGILFALLHGKNIIFKNVDFIDCCAGTHILDLAGCKNVRIIDCKFNGCRLESATNYREMIQTDYANYNAFPYKGDNISYIFDNESCSDIHIENCEFSKGNGTIFPNAIGTHSVHEKYHDHITIKNCKFYDCNYASIRFLRVHDLTIERNEFINNNPATRSDISFILLDNGRYENVCLPDFNILITKNKYTSEIPTSNIMFLHMYSDVTTAVFHRDIEISDNILNGEYQNIDMAIDCFRFGNVERVNISNNIISKFKNIILFRNNFNAKNVSMVNNKFIECRTLESKFNTSTIENTYYKSNTWVTNGIMKIEGTPKYDDIYSGVGISSGTITTSKKITDYEYLLVSTGGIDNNTYMTMPMYPFNMNIGFRPGEDTLTVPTVSGKCILTITDDTTLTIVSTDDAIRRIYGVKNI